VPNVIEPAASIFGAEYNRFLPNVGSHLPMPQKNHDPDYRKSSELLMYNVFVFNNSTSIQARELGHAYLILSHIFTMYVSTIRIYNV